VSLFLHLSSAFLRCNIRHFYYAINTPVQNAFEITEGHLDEILTEMNVSNDEISKLPLELKRKIVRRGGVKVELTSNIKQYYNSLDGNKYLITKENEDEINKIKERDKEKILVQNGNKNTNAVTISTIDVGSESDGIWSAESILFYSGITGNGVEYIYHLYSLFDWSSHPNFFLTDSIVNSWDVGISSANSAGANNYRPNQYWSYTQEPMSITRTIGATRGDIDLQYAEHQYGALEDELRIPTSYHGHTKQLIFSYVHPWIGGLVGVVLDFVGINWSAFTGDEWHWDGVFTVGDS